jgi:acetoin:2,6-dichlorophenolindophenol oxidoreductase subunit alpha
VWKLPVVFVCENNLYMEYTPIGSVTAVENPAADRACAYGLQPIIVDGNDVEAVYRAALDAVRQARDGAGPSLVECKTYRHSGHSRADPAKYRPPEELRAWLERDPVPAYRQRLIADGVPTASLEAIEREAIAKVEHATRVCRESPPPAPETAFTDLWADGGAAWRN